MASTVGSDKNAVADLGAAGSSTIAADTDGNSGTSAKSEQVTSDKSESSLSDADDGERHMLAELDTTLEDGSGEESEAGASTSTTACIKSEGKAGDESGSGDEDSSAFDALDDVFYSRSAQGVMNPVLMNATHASMADWEDFFSLVAFHGNKEVVNMVKAANPSSNMNVKRIVNMVFKGQARLAKMRGLDLKLVKAAFQAAREKNGVRRRQQKIRMETISVRRAAARADDIKVEVDGVDSLDEEDDEVDDDGKDGDDSNDEDFDSGGTDSSSSLDSEQGANMKKLILRSSTARQRLIAEDKAAVTQAAAILMQIASCPCDDHVQAAQTEEGHHLWVTDARPTLSVGQIHDIPRNVGGWRPSSV